MPSLPESKRIILKIPGSAFCPKKTQPVEREGAFWVARQICTLLAAGSEPICVLGSSNLWSGTAAPDAGITQASSDMMGMLATLANSLALRDALIAQGADPRLYSSLHCDQAAAPYVRGKVLSALEKGKAVVLAGGTGNPFFRADTAAALRARELQCTRILRATPPKEFDAIELALAGEWTLEKALALHLLDSTSLAFCKESQIKIVLFESNTENSALQAYQGFGRILTIQPALS